MDKRVTAKKVKKQPTQTTLKGAEIPVPTRGDFFRDLEKVTKPHDRSVSDLEQAVDDHKG